MSTAKFICKQCGTRTNRPAVVTKGSLGIEIVAWLLLLIPGVIYSVWRHTTRGNACPACQSFDLLPGATPMGKRLLEQHADAPVVEATVPAGDRIFTWVKNGLVGLMLLAMLPPLLMVLFRMLFGR